MTSWMRDEPTGPSNEDYLLGKAVDKNFEQQGTMGQINAVEYGEMLIHSAGSDHYFRTCCPSVPTFQNLPDKTTENNVHFWRDCGYDRGDH